MTERLLPSIDIRYGSVQEADQSDASFDTLPAGGHEKMRRRLKYFFMTPCEKYQAKGRRPWKLMLQLVKVLAVTMQLYVFGIEGLSHEVFLESTKVAFRHLYLEGWDPSWETPAYPASHGPYAVYTYDAFFSSLNTALNGYNRTFFSAIGSFDRSNRTSEPVLVINHYANLTVDAGSFSYTIDRNIETRTFVMRPVQFPNGTEQFDSQQLLLSENFTVNFDSIVTAELNFSINAMHFNFDVPRLSSAECFRFDITIEYDNKAHTGQLLVSLRAEPKEVPCRNHKKITLTLKEFLYTLLDATVITVCLGSLMLCARSLYRGNRLRMKTQAYFRDCLKYELTFSELAEFINLWFVLIIINDALTLIGSLHKIMIEYKISSNYTVCSIFLGSGALLVWFGTLRYLGYFEKYNILLLTIKHSLPDILRFMVCAIILFLAFSLFGWIVLGPYHPKFRGFFMSLECLFALVNGDDIFATFALVPSSSDTYIYIVSRVYLYSFLSLFIYIVLNVCISIIIEAYELISQGGLQENSRMWQFIAECCEPASSGAYRQDAELARNGSRRGPAAWLINWLSASLVSRVQAASADSAANNGNHHHHRHRASAALEDESEVEDGVEEEDEQQQQQQQQQHEQQQQQQQQD